MQVFTRMRFDRHQQPEACRWLCITGVFAVSAIMGCANSHAQDEASAKLTDHGMALSFNQNAAFVVQTSSRKERTFSDQDLLDVLPALRTLNRVKRLQLSGSSVTDASVSELKSLQNIEELELIDTGVTRAGLIALGGMPNLHFLLLDGDRLSHDDLVAIQETLPKVQIFIKKKGQPLTRFSQGPERYERPAPY